MCLARKKKRRKRYPHNEEKRFNLKTFLILDPLFLLVLLLRKKNNQVLFKKVKSLYRPNISI